MLSFIHLTQKVREIVDACGIHGKEYNALIEEFNLSLELAVFLARYLKKIGYMFRLKGTSLEFHLIDRIPEDLIIFTHFTCTQIYKFNCLDDNAADLEIQTVLSYLGRSRADGLTLLELQKMVRKKFNINLMDKLIGIDIIVKQTVMPKFVEKKISSSFRTSTICNIFHLKQYVHLFDVEKYGLTLVPPDKIRHSILNHLAEVLDMDQLPYVPVVNISTYLGIFKRGMQSLRNHIQALEKQGEPLSVRFEERKCAAATSSGNIGRIRISWCVVRCSSDPANNFTLHRMRNLPLYDQIDLQLYQRRSITNPDIRKFTSVTRKKSARIGQEFINTFGFPTVKELEYKNFQYRILSKSCHGPVVGDLTKQTQFLKEEQRSNKMTLERNLSQREVKLVEVSTNITGVKRSTTEMEDLIEVSNVIDQGSFQKKKKTTAEDPIEGRLAPSKDKSPFADNINEKDLIILDYVKKVILSGFSLSFFFYNFAFLLVRERCRICTRNRTDDPRLLSRKKYSSN
jgi:hypothetical protein